MRVPRPILFTASALAMVAATACQDHAAVPTAPETRTTEARTVSGIAPFTLGYLTRAHPASPCQAPPYREFDFWLGGWDVENAAGQRVGTNLVRTRADGCIVEENWVAAFNGLPGRSINTYDAETGFWGQTWVAAGGGNLRMYGGLDETGRMVMEGMRTRFDGLEFFDRYEWTRLDGGRVLQRGVLDIPAIPFNNVFEGIYVPVDDFEPIPTNQGTLCQPGGAAEASRLFDYFAGDWTVESEGRSIAAAEVTVDLSGCLFEEVFTTPKGYEAVAFTYYDVLERTWYRTWIDSEGERLDLSGGFDGSSLVLTGSEAGNGASGAELEARMTWTSMPDGSVEVTHETSSDGGDTWRQDLVLVYRGS